MRYGLALPQGPGFDVAVDVDKVARTAEQAGYDSLWAYERVLFPLEPADGMNGIPGLPWIDFYRECADPLAVLAAAGAVTERVRLGTAVLIAPLHPALTVARSFATLSRLTGGRVVAGFGSGWSSDEFRAVGADFASRGQRLEETVDACRTFWGTDPVEYRDGSVEVVPGCVGPKPATTIPVLLGGGRTRPARDRIARKADGWLAPAWPIADVLATWRAVRDGAEVHGRRPDSLQLVPKAVILLSDTPAPADRRPFQGSLDQVLSDLASFRDEADEVVLDLVPSSRDGGELVELSLRVREEITAAGL